jgi:hypothetical protein
MVKVSSIRKKKKSTFSLLSIIPGKGARTLERQSKTDIALILFLPHVAPLPGCHRPSPLMLQSPVKLHKPDWGLRTGTLCSAFGYPQVPETDLIHVKSQEMLTE